MSPNPEVELLPAFLDKNGVPQHYTYTFDRGQNQHVTGWLQVTAEERRNQLLEPTRLSRHLDFWLYHNRFLRAPCEFVSEELVLRMKLAVLSDERALDALRREVEALEKIEKVVRVSREPITASVKMFVWQRDSGRCVKCGSQERLEFDHIIPVVKGGSSTERNLQLLCEPCNRAKSSLIS